MKTFLCVPLMLEPFSNISSSEMFPLIRCSTMGFRKPSLKIFAWSSRVLRPNPFWVWLNLSFIYWTCSTIDWQSCIPPFCLCQPCYSSLATWWTCCWGHCCFWLQREIDRLARRTIDRLAQKIPIDEYGDSRHRHGRYPWCERLWMKEVELASLHSFSGR